MCGLTERGDMWHEARIGVGARWLAVLALLVGCCGAEALEAGAAKAEITPLLGTPLNGYGDRMGRGCVAVHDPVWVRCLYLSDGATRLFLVNADLCIINRELRERVLELAPREVPKDHIILTATHTHSAQGGMVRSPLFRSVSGRFAPDVLEKTAARFAETMRAAYERRRQAAIGYGTGEQTTLSTNRRVADGPIDRQIGVIRVDDADGAAIAIVGNFAAHPTTVGGADKMSVSADYCGYYYEELEKLCPAGTVAVFLNGAEGNQRPANPEDQAGWGRTESIGRLLAVRVKSIANGIKCGDAKLRIAQARPDLPRTMASFLVPSTVLLQTLEINDLLLTFVPGEACVEIGHGLRERALARGYGAQFTVGLSNDFLAYFVPAEYYGHMYYETGMNFYGPWISRWFYEQFTRLMRPLTLPAESEDAWPATSAAAVEEVGEAKRVVLTGSPYEVGFQRGAAFREAIVHEYEGRVVGPVEAGVLLPQEGLWATLSSYLHTTDYSLVVLGMGSRPLLQGVSNGLIEEVQGMADGVEVPFDALWLVQCTPTFGARSDNEAFFRTAFCTMFASVGDRAGADDLLVGRNLDWAGDQQPVIVDVRPATGRRFVQVGFPWNVGVFSGMNDAGLVVCAERMAALGEPDTEGAPVEFVLRELLQTAGSVEQALERLRDQTHLKGCHVLVAGPEGDGSEWASQVQVVEFGESIIVRGPDQGFVLGADPESDLVDEAAKARYSRVSELLKGEHIIASAKIKKALQDGPARGGGAGCVWNADTKHSIVFRPTARVIEVAFPDDTGMPCDYAEIALREEAP